MDRILEPEEIDQRIGNSYLNRLSLRSRNLRLLFTRKDWTKLKSECSHIRSTARIFGYHNLAEAAETVEKNLPTKNPNLHLPVTHKTRESISALFSEMDRILSVRNLREKEDIF